jgi:hypothetical protein
MTRAFITSVMCVAAILISLVRGSAQSPAPTDEPAPLDRTRAALQRASNALSHSANQSCDVEKAAAAVKAALKDVAASAAFLAGHPDSGKLPPLPPAVQPDFVAPPRPAPQRNAMLESALKELQTAFRRLSDVPGTDLGGHRDDAYQHIDAAAGHLIAAIKAANAAFREGRRELPACEDGGAIGSR